MDRSVIDRFQQADSSQLHKWNMFYQRLHVQCVFVFTCVSVFVFTFCCGLPVLDLFAFLTFCLILFLFFFQFSKARSQSNSSCNLNPEKKNCCEKIYKRSPALSPTRMKRNMHHVVVVSNEEKHIQTLLWRPKASRAGLNSISVVEVLPVCVNVVH